MLYTIVCRHTKLSPITIHPQTFLALSFNLLLFATTLLFENMDSNIIISIIMHILNTFRLTVVPNHHTSDIITESDKIEVGIFNL